MFMVVSPKNAKSQAHPACKWVSAFNSNAVASVLLSPAWPPENNEKSTGEYGAAGESCGLSPGKIWCSGNMWEHIIGASNTWIEWE